MNKNIELEMRAEISHSNFDTFLSFLKTKYTLSSHTKRLSVIFLGKANDIHLDIRIRIDSDNKSEVVFKKGNYHSDDREEFSQEIEKGQFFKMVDLMANLGFYSKIMERETHRFKPEADIEIALVTSGDISYVEIEKMTNKDNIDKDRTQLLSIINEHNLCLIEDEETFNNLCKRLTDESDWTFSASEEDFSKLKKIFNRY